MNETRKVAAILAADVVGFSRLTSADEDRAFARLRAICSIRRPRKDGLPET
jgi:adenylate cyclase